MLLRQRTFLQSTFLFNSITEKLSEFIYFQTKHGLNFVRQPTTVGLIDISKPKVTPC